MILTPVSKDLLPQIKSVIWPLLERGVAVDEGRATAEGVWKQIESGDSQLWVVMDDTIRAIVLTAIIEYPNLKACDIELCAGFGRKDWLHLLPELEQWAREQGCEVIEGRMRPGWKLNDYRVRRHMMEKRL